MNTSDKRKHPPKPRDNPRGCAAKPSVTFGLRAKDLDPEEITSLLGIKASYAFKRGEKYRTRIDKDRYGIRKYPFGVWQLRSEECIVSDDFKEHVDCLARLLEPKRAQIGALLAREGMYVDVRLWIESYENVYGFTLPSRQVLTLASLCHEINVSVILGELGQAEGAHHDLEAASE